MNATKSKFINRRKEGNNIWLTAENSDLKKDFTKTPILPYKYEVLETEEAVGQAMSDELKEAVRTKNGGDLVMLLLGGRGAQAMYRILGKQAESGEIDDLLAHLHVFTQDALAPVRMNNGLSFVRDFERLLGDAFFSKSQKFHADANRY